MRGKTIVITGGTSGIGEVAAVALARMGARIVLVARDKIRADATVARLRESGPGIAHSVHFADLLRLAEIKRVAAQIADSEPRIDILINNAGAMFASRRLTEDGLECTFALNHMAYFVLTQGLRERLSASGPARIINTASRRSDHQPHRPLGKSINGAGECLMLTPLNDRRAPVVAGLNNAPL
jgi:NAD(P)-dependent dehydrogenase (short-subunit alcohol dehydrogenase family)